MPPAEYRPSVTSLQYWKVYLHDLNKLIKNCAFSIKLGAKCCCGCVPWDRLLLGSVLAPLLVNIYINDQSIYPNAGCFIYANEVGSWCKLGIFPRTCTHQADQLLHYQSLWIQFTMTRINLCYVPIQFENKGLNINWNDIHMIHCTIPLKYGVSIEIEITGGGGVNK